MRYLTEGSCPVEGAAWQVCAVIAWHADKTTGDAYISRRNIAIQARLSTGTVHAVLLDLVDRGVLEIVVAGTGRRAMTYRVVTQSPSRKADPVVAQSTDRSGSVGQPVVAQLTGPSIGGREEQEGIEGRAGGAAADAAAPRSQQPATVPDWRAALNGQGPVARPVSAAAATAARQAAPDPAAQPPRPRRGARGRKGRRGREPPTTCHRSHTIPPVRLDTG